MTATAVTVAVVGGGLSGTLFALKLTRARPDFRVVLIERAPRMLFGHHLQEQVEAALVVDGGPGLAAVRVEAVRLASGLNVRVRLSDGRDVRADIVVLATGNMPPGAPGGRSDWLYDSPFHIADPWAAEAFEGLPADAPLLLLGAGLTTVDIALKLDARGHRGAILALSRHGLVPATHTAGGIGPVAASSRRRM